jgi:Zn-dependent protease/CBS domain-containing protein
MGWSWRLGRIAGIDVYVHATFALLLLWVGLAYYAPRQSVEDAVGGLAFILCLFGIVVLHELGHALAARRYGIKTRDITLLPIGGVARLERMPEDPKQELVVALAGPAVNVVLAGVLFAVLLAAGQWVGPEQLAAFATSFGGGLLIQLFVANVFLAVFNMLPAFPMDGGRVLRALLAMRMDYVRATRTAAGVGQFMAVLFGLVGLFGFPPLNIQPNLFLVIIALFVWVGAAGEAAAVQFKAGLAGIPVGRAMVREFATLTADDTLRTAAGKVLDGFQHDFPVVADGAVVGILTGDNLLTGLTEAGPAGRVADFMRTDFKTADPYEMVEPAMERLKDGCCPVLPVLDKGALVGLLTPENVSELVMIREAVRGRPVAGPKTPVEQAS